ncbi:MAG: helix-turn-helix domain-containing protein [Anaerolineae bacterium]
MSEEITPKEAAELTGYALAYIWDLCRSGRINARKVAGRVYLIDKADFLAYVERMEQDPRGGPRKKE